MIKISLFKIILNKLWSLKESGIYLHQQFIYNQSKLK